MNPLKFMSREKLVEYLDEELRTFLNDKGIYELNQYGWLMDDSPDPEYLGLAMWQREPPGRRSAPITGPLLPGVDMAEIAAAGKEYEIYMQTARQSIGFTFLYHETSRTLADNLDFCFWHHYADTVMKLNLATECLRKMFINAFDSHVEFSLPNNLPRAASNPRDTHNYFCRPFHEAAGKLAEAPEYYEEILDCFNDLLPLVEQTSFSRLDGLEISSNKSFFQDACLGDISLNGQPEMLFEGKEQPSLVSDSVPHDITQWYKTLVKTGNQVFLAEYLIRNFDRESVNC